MSIRSNMKYHSKISGDTPQVHPSAFVDPTARLIGNVEIGPNVYIGPNVVIRADERDHNSSVKPIVIGENTTVQDGVVIHTHAGHSVHIGKNCCLTHSCLVHGPCEIGDGCFIGFKSIVYMSTLGEGAFVHAGCVVQNVEIAPDLMVPAGLAITSDSQLSSLTAVDADEVEPIRKVAQVNIHQINGYNNM